MNVLKNIDFYDFSFNGKKLSEFHGIVGGSEPLTTYPLLPSRVYITDRAIGQDGMTVFDSYLEPRTFDIPVFFEDIDSAGIRNIASWFDVEEPAWFQFENDDVRIKCCLDSNGSALETIMGADGQANLKFIAHDPYYYEAIPTVHEYTGLSGSSFTQSYENKSQSISYPRIEIYGTDEIGITIKNSSGDIVSECTMSNVKSGVIIDSMSGDVFGASGASYYNNFSGTLPKIPKNDNYSLEVTGTVTRIKFTPNYRWI